MYRSARAVRVCVALECPYSGNPDATGHYTSNFWKWYRLELLGRHPGTGPIESGNNPQPAHAPVGGNARLAI